MKFLAIFMTFLMLASGFDLCADPDSCESSDATEISKDVQRAKPELCSPFCQCARCPFSVLIPKTIKSTDQLVFARRNYPYLTPGIPIKVSYSIWQPPKTA